MTALENGLDAINAQHADPLLAAKCRALLRGYDARFRSAGYLPTAVETMLVAPLFNPETGRKARNLSMAGKLDVIVRYNGRLIVFDHKTTSQDITDPDAPYWRQLAIEGQATHYMLLSWTNGVKCNDAIWDVLRKPQTAPKKLSAADRKAVLAFRKYYDVEISQESFDALVADDRETVELYEARLTHDCTKERPQHYFQRRPVPRLDSELLEYARELWEHGQELLHVRRHDRHTRNSGACLLYGSPCRYLGICSGYDTPDSDKWARKGCVHNELPMLDGDGRDVLTNSRVRTFQTCRRKHYYDYEMGIERWDEEEKEALAFGTLWHVALEAWWTTFLTEDCNEHDNEPARNERANSAGAAVDAG